MPSKKILLAIPESYSSFKFVENIQKKVNQGNSFKSRRTKSKAEKEKSDSHPDSRSHLIPKDLSDLDLTKLGTSTSLKWHRELRNSEGTTRSSKSLKWHHKNVIATHEGRSWVVMIYSTIPSPPARMTMAGMEYQRNSGERRLNIGVLFDQS